MIPHEFNVAKKHPAWPIPVLLDLWFSFFLLWKSRWGFFQHCHLYFYASLSKAAEKWIQAAQIYSDPTTHMFCCFCFALFLLYLLVKIPVTMVVKKKTLMTQIPSGKWEWNKLIWVGYGFPNHQSFNIYQQNKQQQFVL